MNVPARISLFGACSGLVWSFAAIFCSARGTEVVEAFPAIGAMTGIVVSFALYYPLLKVGRRMTLILGVLALPLGTFCFGVCYQLLSTLWKFHQGSPFSFGDVLYGPIYFGFLYMYLATVTCIFSYYGLILFPSAVVTTYLLRATISRPGFWGTSD